MTTERKDTFQKATSGISSANKAAKFKEAKGVVAQGLAAAGINLAALGMQNDKQA